MKKSTYILGTLALTAASTNAAIVLGDVIKIDFGADSGAVANYNEISSTALTDADLVRFSDGASTGIGMVVTTSNNPTGLTDGDNVFTLAGNAGNTTDTDIFGDHMQVKDSDGSSNLPNTDSIILTFSGLDDSLAYDLVGGISRDTGKESAFSSNWTINGSTVVGSDASTASGYLNISSVSSVGGVLTIQIDDSFDGSSNVAAIAQLELTAVAIPEPSSAALLGLGGLALILRRRK